MRRLIDKAQGAARRSQRAAFLQSRDLRHRQSLSHGAVHLVADAGTAQGEFSRRQPVHRLAIIAHRRHIHFAVKAPHEFGPELGVVVKKQHRRVHAARPGIGGDDLAFPLELEQIPVRSKFLGIDQILVVVDVDAAAVADEDKYVFAFGIDVLVPSLPPFALVDYVGQEQKRLYRLQSFADVKRGVCRSFAAAEYIHQIFSRPALRDDARAEIAAPRPELVDLDFRKGALESLHDFDGDRTLIENVWSDLALFLRRRHGFFPLDLPGRLNFRRETRGAAQQKNTKANRSEERRVGKECRSRWSPYH